ncbi:hypothetical protein V496_08931 [Pseudogymnoascus sp. VKM F-4515 (FW-2607)]|nr:hypothetical protein V496_08931 [Pseudogymnoascus sp. VKM F-4515 (FW-2607)]
MAPEIPKRMKAIQLVEFKRPYEIREIDVPINLDPPDLLVKVAVASYCHTDVMVEQGVFAPSCPQTASHEGSGTVVAVGSDAAKHFKIGDRVMCGLPLHPCGTCDDCLGPENQRQYCMNLEVGHIGLNTDGCFAEYVRCDSRFTAKLPNEVSLMSAAPLACAGRTAWRAVLKTGLKSGQCVCFVGSGGGLGHLGIQFAKALGLKVIGIDARDEGLELSKKHGADVVLDARRGKADLVKRVHAITAGKGVDAAVSLSDHKDASGIACAVTKMHGTMVQIAQPDIVEIPFRELIFRDVRIVGSCISGVEETKSMLDTIAKHGVTVTTVPFQGLDKIDELSKLVHSGKLKGKAVIVVDPEQIDHDQKIGAKF